MNHVKQKLRENWALALAAALLLAALCYVAVCGQGIYVTVADNLDSNIPWFTMLRENDLFFAQNAAVPFLGGIDRDYLVTERSLYSLLYWLLPAFPAFVAGNFLKILLSVAGWAALGRCLAADRGQPLPGTARNLLVLGGFVYGILPTYPTEAFAFASLPLLLALLWQLYRRPRPWQYLLVFLYPLLSDFAFFGIFLCGYLLLFFLLDWLRCRRPAWRMLAALALLCLGYVVMEYRLFAVMLLRGEPTLRDEMAFTPLGLRDTLKTMLQAFWRSEFGGPAQPWLFMPVCCLYWLWLNAGYLRRRTPARLLTDPFNVLMYWQALNAVLCGLNQNGLFWAVINRVLPPLKGFNFSRAGWSTPFLACLAFFVVLLRLADRGWRKPACALALAALVMAALLPGGYNEIRHNLENTLLHLQGQTPEELTWGEFYSEDLFTQAKQDIGYNGEWAAAWGMHPGVLEQNGIATLDGYLSRGPLAYKHTFRTVIAPQLEQSDYHRTYYDGWGGRAYLFSGEVGYAPVRTPAADHGTLNIDADAFRALGGVYLFSRVAVDNAGELGFTLLGVYTDDASPYTLYVYRTGPAD